MRILILGNPGSDKTRLAETLAHKTGIAWTDLDDLVWKRKFDIPRHRNQRKNMLARILKRKHWILAGTPSEWNTTAIPLARKIIILRLPFLTETFSICTRAISRAFSKNPPREKVSGILQLIWWDLTEFHLPSGKKKLVLEFIQQRYASRVVVLRSRKQVIAFSNRTRKMSTL